MVGAGCGGGGRGGVPLQGAYRLLAYRAASAAPADGALLASWRWKMRLWDEGDRRQFADTMARAYQSVLDRTRRSGRLNAEWTARQEEEDHA